MNSFLFRHQWLILAFCWLLSGFLLPGTDIAAHDIYIVVTSWHIAILGFIVFVFLWSLQRVPAMRVIEKLYVFHTIITTIAGIVVLGALFWAFTPKPQRYRDYSVYAEFDTSPPDTLNRANVVITIALIVFLLTQLAWIVQLIAFIAGKKRNL